MVPLALDLLRASSWFNDAMAERMRRRGFPLLTPSQSYVMAQLLIGPPEEITAASTAAKASPPIQGLISVASPTPSAGRRSSSEPPHQPTTHLPHHLL